MMIEFIYKQHIENIFIDVFKQLYPCETGTYKDDFLFMDGLHDLGVWVW